MSTVIDTHSHAVTSYSGGQRNLDEPPSSPTTENVAILSPMKGSVNVKATKGGFMKEGDCIAEIVSVKVRL